MQIKNNGSKRIDDRIRIGILVDGTRVPSYVNSMLNDIHSHSDMNLVAVISHPDPEHSHYAYPFKYFLNNFFRPAYLLHLFVKCLTTIVTSLEFLFLHLINRSSTVFDKQPLSICTATMICVIPQISEETEECTYSHEEIALLQSLELDFIVAESKHRPSTEIVKSCSKFGVIRMHFDGPTADYHRFAGFKEACNHNPSTQFCITRQQSTEDTVIFNGAFKTRFFLLENRNELVRKAYPYIVECISKTFLNPGYAKSHHCRVSYENRTIDFSSSLSVREVLFGLTYNISRGFLTRLCGVAGWKVCWQIAWHRGEWQNVGKEKSCTIKNPNGSYLADPFIIEKQGRQICFAEELNFQKNYGVISALEIFDSSYKMLGTVLDESSHLSFPFIFEYDSELYMCPESLAAGEIRLYRCVNFPLQWEYHTTLMQNVCAVDTMLVEIDGRWWMFTNIDPQGSDDLESRLYVFWSNSPLSTNWTPHTQNPVVFDPLVARNAGYVTKNGEFFRCGQRQGHTIYGEGFSIRKITDLTTTTYAEEPVLNIGPEHFDSLGTHHIHHNNEITVHDECRFMRIK